MPHPLLQGNHRKLRVTAQPNVTLSWRHLPARCRRARTLLLGPLMPEVRCGAGPTRRLARACLARFSSAVRHA